MHQYHTLPLCTVPQAQVPTSNLAQRSWSKHKGNGTPYDLPNLSTTPRLSGPDPLTRLSTIAWPFYP